LGCRDEIIAGEVLRPPAYLPEIINIQIAGLQAKATAAKKITIPFSIHKTFCQP
jgi:uncharacterized protein YdeI (YjbR/CyaY-like superfamily)